MKMFDTSLKNMYAEAIQAQIHADVRTVFFQKADWTEQEIRKCLSPLELWFVDHIRIKAIKKFAIRHIEIKEQDVLDGILVKIYHKGRFVTEKVFSNKPIKFRTYGD